MKKDKKNNGFSLIELVVVITIMAVITALVSINFASAGKRSRDARRMTDLEKVRIALEMIRQAGTTYPAVSAGGAIPNVLMSGYIQAIPTDPKSDGSYCYDRPTNYSYILYAKMEDIGSTNIASVTCNGKTYDYKVVNP
jgi:general secretion pathway protein G